MSTLPMMFWSPGTQTQSFVPWRSTVRLPSLSISATVASLVIQEGPASMARLIFSFLIASAMICSSDSLCVWSYMTLLSFFFVTSGQYPGKWRFLPSHVSKPVHFPPSKGDAAERVEGKLRASGCIHSQCSNLVLLHLGHTYT